MIITVTYPTWKSVTLTAAGGPLTPYKISNGAATRVCSAIGSGTNVVVFETTALDSADLSNFNSAFPSAASIASVSDLLALQMSNGLALVSTANSSSAPLGSGATFTGQFESLLGAAFFTIGVRADQASATGGFMIDWSNDGISALRTETTTLPANTGRCFALTPRAQYIRLRYTNGAIAQSSFSLQLVLRPDGTGLISRPLSENLNDDNFAQTVRSVNAIRSPATGLYINQLGDKNGFAYGSNIQQAIYDGSVSGISGRFSGRVMTSDTVEVAVLETTFVEQSSNAQRSFSSSSASDTAAGTGARTIRLTYYSFSAGVVSGPLTEDVVLNGTTAVNTVATNICFVETIEVLTVGATGANVGILTIFASTNGGGGAIASVEASAKRTAFAHHYVASNRNAFLTDLYISSTASVGNMPKFNIRTLDYSLVNATERSLMDDIYVQGSTGSNNIPLQTPLIARGPCRIRTYVAPSNGTSQVQSVQMGFYEF